MVLRLWLTGMLLFAAGCNSSKPPAGNPSAPQAPSIKVAQPRQGNLVRVIEQPATIIANQEAPLHAKMSGFVKNYYVDIGQEVRGPRRGPDLDSKSGPVDGKEQPGDLLAELWVPELEAEGREKAARKRQAGTEVKQAVQLLTVAKENVNAMAAQANEARFAIKRAEATFNRWESERSRIAKLVSERSIEPQIGEETTNQYLAAEAAWNEAKSRQVTAEANVRKSEAERDKAEADVQVAQARYDVATAEAERLADLLQYTRICAPFDGVIVQRRVDKGHFIQLAGDPRSVALFTLAGVDVVRAVVEVPEADASLIKVDDAVDLLIPALKGKVVTGKISRTAGALQTGSRTLRVEIDIPNHDRALKPGNYGNAKIKAMLDRQWLLPAAAVASAGDTTSCFLIEGERVRRIEVRVGRSDGSLVEVLKKRQTEGGKWQDWSGNEIVAASGTAYLSDGQTVQLDEPKK